jgi:broad specificity phosphatase PhoE
MHLFFVRHGQSQANAGQATATPASILLTERGQEQARRMAASFPLAPALVVTSPYLRTSQTAAPLRERFAGVAHEEWPVEEITFLSPERFRDTSRAERLSHVQSYWERSDPAHVDGPGAESFLAFWGRVSQALARARAEARQPLVIVGHGTFMQAALFQVLHPGPAPDSERMRHFRAFCHVMPILNTALLEVRELDGRLLCAGPTTDHLEPALHTA